MNTVSVDDLITTMASSHIGQEAMDLQLLQSQLKQMLFSQSISSTSSSSRSMSCNTPKGRRTPSNSVSWGMVDAAPTWSTSPRSGWGEEQQQWGSSRSDFDDSEDERMVEDLLIPSSPRRAPTQSSSFATTDPFYLAQLQQSQQQSAFAQMGKPAQQSPFVQQQQQSSFTQQTEQRNPHAMFEFMSTSTF